jgi:SAM-dependent methyltransferase
MAGKASDPWSGYWRGEATGQAAAASLGETDPAVRAVLDRPWHELAAMLPRRAALLDLATGGGIVLRTLQSLRKDLRLTGVDAAAELPRLAGAKMAGGVNLAALPFADNAFDAVTSRFGIEYADVAEAAREAARVLKPGGTLSFVVHHAQSPIVAHNRARLEALRWAWSESGMLEKARSLARSRRVAALPTPRQFSEAAAQARGLFPAQPVAWEFLTAITQTLDMGLGRPESEVLGVLDTLAERASGETARLEQLQAAACDEGRVAALGEALGAGGVSMQPPGILTPGGGAHPLAWSLTGTK